MAQKSGNWRSRRPVAQSSLPAAVCGCAPKKAAHTFSQASRLNTSAPTTQTSSCFVVVFLRVMPSSPPDKAGINTKIRRTPQAAGTTPCTSRRTWKRNSNRRVFIVLAMSTKVRTALLNPTTPRYFSNSGTAACTDSVRPNLSLGLLTAYIWLVMKKTPVKNPLLIKTHENPWNYQW